MNELIKQIKHYEAIKAEMNELKTEINVKLKKIGVDEYFQDETDKLVYKVVRPLGTFIEFSDIGYVRTIDKTRDEKRGSLSIKEAKEKGFNV